MFETYEQMYLSGINSKSNIAPIQLRESLIKLIKRDKDRNPQTGERQLAQLFAAYEMYTPRLQLPTYTGS